DGAVEENMVRLARLEDAGDLPRTAEDALALAYADRHERAALCRGLVAVARSRRRAMGFRHDAACIRPRTNDLPGSRTGVRAAGYRYGGKDCGRCRAARPRRPPPVRDGGTVGRKSASPGHAR